MKDFGNLLGLIPIEYVSAVTANGVTLKPGCKPDLFLTENSVTPSEGQDQKDPGTVYTQSLRVTTDKLTPQQRMQYARNRRCIAWLYHSNGEFTIWGSIDIPITVSVYPYINSDQISIARKALSPLL